MERCYVEAPDPICFLTVWRASLVSSVTVALARKLPESIPFAYH